MEVRVPTPTTVYVSQPPPPVETHEKAISPVVLPPIAVLDQSTEPAMSRLTNVDEQLETIKSTYEEKISKLHDSYQYVIFEFSLQRLLDLFVSTFRAEIRRLTKLLNETPSRRSSQMADLSELDESGREITDEETPNIHRRSGKQSQKREPTADTQPTPAYGKDLPRGVSYYRKIDSKCKKYIIRQLKSQENNEPLRMQCILAILCCSFHSYISKGFISLLSV